MADTVTLLNHMAREGHKVSLTKLQFCAAGNNFFWVTLRPNNKAISEKRIKAIKDVPRPLTNDNYYHSWECVHIVERLFQIMHF